MGKHNKFRGSQRRLRRLQLKSGSGQTIKKRKEWEKYFNMYQQEFNEKGLFMRDVDGDGNCLFRSIADQLTGNEGVHKDYRMLAVQAISDNKDFYSLFITEGQSLDRHLENMKKDGTWGGDFEIVALSQVLGVKFCIHTFGQIPYILKSSLIDTYHRTLHLVFHKGEHYSSLRNLSDDTKNPATKINLKEVIEGEDEDQQISCFAKMRNSLSKLKVSATKIKDVTKAKIFGITYTKIVIIVLVAYYLFRSQEIKY